MRKFLSSAAAVVSAGLVVVAVAVAGTDRGSEPVLVEGNPDCVDLAGLSYTNQVRFKDPVNGSSAEGINVLLVDPTTNIQWYVNNESPHVTAVIVKGGTRANVYRYPGTVDFSDGHLTTPLGTNGKPSRLGALVFCYKP
jgi:hypothetical protein